MNSSPPPVRVLVVDDQPPYRTAAKLLFEVIDGFEVVGEAASGSEALAQAESLDADLVIMDINLPGMSGIEATRRLVLARPSTSVVLVSTYREDELPQGAATSGALAYVHKERLGPDLVVDLWHGREGALWRTA